MGKFYFNMTYGEILQEAFQKLSKNKYITNPHLEAEILLSKITRQRREYILTYKENKISLVNRLKFNYLIYRRANNYPLAYLVREKYFYGYKFRVNKHTLIPRWESEMIVDEIIDIVKNKPKEKYSIIDVGTGTGCIIISTLKELVKRFEDEKQNFKIDISGSIAIDISSQALKVAKHNADLHELKQKIKFLNGNLLDFLVNDKKRSTRCPEDVKCPEGKNKPHLIISANLPYLNLGQLKHPSIKYEPFLALYGGSGGLDYYRQLLEQIRVIRGRYSQISLFMEIDSSQKKSLNSLILKIYPQAKIETKKDLKGLSRLVCADL